MDSDFLFYSSLFTNHLKSLFLTKVEAIIHSNLSTVLGYMNTIIIICYISLLYQNERSFHNFFILFQMFYVK